MRLLNSETFELRNFDTSPPPKYVILSHRWYEDEIEYDSLQAKYLRDGTESGRGCDKIRNACRIARENQLGWIWIDSCCINKASSEEITRSINSMFRWYQEADVCYTYLFDVQLPLNRATKLGPFTRNGEHGQSSEWFERGWTLQELLAPRNMVFFDANWERIGTRADLADEVGSVTGIDANYLNGTEAFRSASVAKRLSWQSHRRTTMVEDIAYSLVGVLGISLIPIYGEGSRAFMRLQEAFLTYYPDESLFAWTAPSSDLPLHTQRWGEGEWGLLAPSVICFSESRDVVLGGRNAPLRGRTGISRVPGGVKFPILYKDRFETLKLFLLPPIAGIFIWPIIWSLKHKMRTVFKLTLNCYRPNPWTGQLQNVQLNITRHGDGNLWRRCQCWKLQVRRGEPDTSSTREEYKDITILQPEVLH